MDLEHSALARTYRMVMSTGMPLSEAAPLVDPASIGAASAIGLENREQDLHITLFAFTTQSEHSAAQAQLRAALPASNVYTLFGSNGPVLFVGYTHTDGSNGQPRLATSRLDQLGQAFAGEE